MKKLTDREIVRIHDMRRMGIGPFEIARELMVSPNAITAHLHGDVTYPPSIQRKISQVSPLVADGWLCRRMAAPWLPGHPSPAKMRVLMTSKSWMGNAQKPPLRSKLVNGRRVTRIEWLADYVRENFPEGIWIRVETLRVYSTSNADLAELPRLLGKRLYGYPAAVACRLATASGVTLELPSPLVHRAVQIEQRVGMALV